jgi:glucosylceramidase
MKLHQILLPAGVFLLVSCSNNAIVSTTPEAEVDTTTNNKIIAWITSGDEKLLLSRQPAVPLASASSNENRIDVDTTQKYQAMDGFGYTLTGGSAMVISQMPANSKEQLLQELFGENDSGIRINYLRLSIGASDLNDSVFTYDDMPAGETDTALQQFSLENDRVLIDLLKQIVAIQPAIRIMATPWTPPVWMKTNGNSVGGSLKPEYHRVYAQYFVRYVQEMKKEGITIDAITPQNEPLHPGNNPSLLMPAEQQGDFIKNHLGPAFRDAGIQTKIVIYDHNCDKPEYPLTVLNDPGAKQFVDGSAFHLYAGDISALSQVRQAHPDKNIYFTEQYTAIESKFEGDLEWHIKNLIIGAPRNWSKTVLEWNLANDVNFGPHTPGGCTTCKGALTIDGAAIKRNVAYYIIAHASRFVPYGSVRVGSSGGSNLQHVAYATPQGSKVLIVLNEGDAPSSFSMRMHGRSAKLSLPASSVGTFVID